MKISCALSRLLSFASVATLCGITQVGVAASDMNETQPASLSPEPWLISQAFGYLQLDDSGVEVEDLQIRLAELGYYDGPVTGYFGPLTEDAVLRFQQDNGLFVDGVVGPETLALLEGQYVSDTGGISAEEVLPASGLLQLGDRGPEVSALQSRLTTLGFYNGAIDGDFGPLTEAAVIRFQQSRGLVADGIVGPSTLTALNSAQPPTNPPPTNPPPTNPPPTNPPPTTPPDISGRYSVLDLQEELADEGFYFGPLNGILDAETLDAIEDAQASYGLTEGDILAR